MVREEAEEADNAFHRCDSAETQQEYRGKFGWCPVSLVLAAICFLCQFVLPRIRFAVVFWIVESLGTET